MDFSRTSSTSSAYSVNSMQKAIDGFDRLSSVNTIGSIGYNGEDIGTQQSSIKSNKDMYFRGNNMRTINTPMHQGIVMYQVARTPMYQAMYYPRYAKPVNTRSLQKPTTIPEERKSMLTRIKNLFRKPKQTSKLHPVYVPIDYQTFNRRGGKRQKKTTDKKGNKRKDKKGGSKLLNNRGTIDK